MRPDDVRITSAQAADISTWFDGDVVARAPKMSIIDAIFLHGRRASEADVMVRSL